MLSSFLGNKSGAENGDQNDKIMNALGPVIAENWTKVSRVCI